MPWAVNTPKGQVRLMDLPLEVLAELEESTDTKWTTLLTTPAVTMRCAIAVYQTACKQVDAEPEQLTAAQFVDGKVFETVEDDLPTTFDEGLPKVEGGEPTGSSSGQPNDTGGPRK